MKKIIYLWTIIGIIVFQINSCEFVAPGEGEVSTNLSGEVVEAISGNAIANASVKITDGTLQVNTTTNTEGKYSVDISLQEDKELTIVTFKEGYSTDTLKVFANVGSTVEVPTLKLKQLQGSGGNPSGQAASIYLFYQSATSVGVKESGTNETAQFIFELLDSTGVPINSNYSVLVNFNFGSSPGGGEYLYPSSSYTKRTR